MYSNKKTSFNIPIEDRKNYFKTQPTEQIFEEMQMGYQLFKEIIEVCEMLIPARPVRQVRATQVRGQPVRVPAATLHAHEPLLHAVHPNNLPAGAHAKDDYRAGQAV